MDLMKSIVMVAAALVATVSSSTVVADDKKRPNIILMMADDLGYGDTGFNGNKIIKTPYLDQMAKDGVIMSNFHAAAPVCSPTRGSVVTGRQPFRYGIFGANIGHLPTEEITLPELLQAEGYATGHFGKWHLGTLSKTTSPKGPSRRPEDNYSIPSMHGYDHSFVTESAVATWDPSFGGRAQDNPFWLDGKALPAEDPTLKGGAGRVVMDRALSFIEKSVKADKPFFTVIWFHAPHAPVVAGPKYLAMYPDHGQAAHYYGAITEMDEQVGRLRALLSTLNVDDNTFISFTSDNGPEGKQVKGKHAGVTAGLRGRKRSLFEGGVRVPTLMLHPAELPAGKVIDAPTSTLDYLPTVLAMTGTAYPDDRPVDGNNIVNVMKGKTQQGEPIPFYHKSKLVLVQDHFKYMVNGKDLNSEELYDLSKDIAETTNVIKQHPELAKKMKATVVAFRDSFKTSHSGVDYPTAANYQPVDVWPSDKMAADGKSKAEKLQKRAAKAKKKNKKKKNKNS